jgi:hypothetical protein
MDAAAAARMSDPDLNPHFRRRWLTPDLLDPTQPVRSPDVGLGPIGRALLEAQRRKQQKLSAPAAPSPSDNPVQR